MNTSILKTLWFNFYYLPIRKAVFLPIRVAKKTKILSMGAHDAVEINNVKQKIGIGFGSSFALAESQWGGGKFMKVEKSILRGMLRLEEELK